MSIRGRWKGPLKVEPLRRAWWAGRRGAGSRTTRRIRGRRNASCSSPGSSSNQSRYFTPRCPGKLEGGDEDLVVGPPELHIVLVGLGGLAQAVDEVEQAAVLLIPAGLDGLSRRFHGGGVRSRVAARSWRPPSGTRSTRCRGPDLPRGPRCTSRRGVAVGATVSSVHLSSGL